jgi:hypothetical protein
MAKLIDGDDLIVSTNITIDTTARTFTLVASADGSTTNGLIAKDGVTLQALYSKFIKLWETSAYNSFPFPMYAIDAKSGQFQFGFDGSKFSDWGPADDTTRNMLRDGGFDEFQAGGTPDLDGTSSTGDLARRYVGIVSLGDVNTGAQLYYQLASSDAAVDFEFDDEVNQAIQIFGDSAVDAGSANINKQAFFRAFAREEGFTYADSTLADTGQTATGAFTVNVLLSNAVDTNVVNTDAEIVGSESATYTNIVVDYFSTGQATDINDVNDDFPFSIIVDGNGATLQQIYTKLQYLLRQDADINDGGNAGTVNGKTASLLAEFEGSTLKCKQGVFISNFNLDELNNVEFIDDNGVTRVYNFASSGTLQFNSFLASGGTGYFTMFITDSVTGANDYGTANAIVLDDKDGADISGTITSGSIPFTFAYDTNTQGGRSVFTEAGGQVPVTVIAGNKGVAKPVVATATITKAKGITISLVAEQDRAYVE